MSISPKTFSEVFAIYFPKRIDACVPILRADLAVGIPMPVIQARLFRHVNSLSLGEVFRGATMLLLWRWLGNVTARKFILYTKLPIAVMGDANVILAFFAICQQISLRALALFFPISEQYV